MTSAGFPIQIRQARHGVLERFGGRRQLGGGRQQDFRFGRRDIGNFNGGGTGGTLRGYRLVTNRCGG